MWSSARSTVGSVQQKWGVSQIVTNGEMAQLSPISPRKKLGIDRFPNEFCGGRMFSRKPYYVWSIVLLVCVATVAANAQSFRVQCPTSTLTHPTAANSEPAYTGATTFTTGAGGYL